MKQKTIVAPEAKQAKRVDVHSHSDEEAQDIRDRVAAHKRALQTYESKQQYIYPLERLTQDKTVLRNIKFPGADDVYPGSHQALMRFCSSYYPNAKCGPLYVDEPKNEVELDRAYQRHKVMRKLKIKHVVLERDTTFEHLLEQLGEF